MATATLNGTPAIGPRIRALREAMDLSLRDLAERSGVSAPMLSQVERGETSPTLAIAGRIAAGLELTLSQLLRLDEGGTVSVVRRARAPARRQPRARARLRGPDPGRCPASAPRSRATPSRPAPPPAAPATRRCTSPAAARRRSSRRAASSWSATASATSSRAGDTVTFDADLPHHFENPGPDEATLPGRRLGGPATQLGAPMPTTLFDKIWDAHEVAPGLLYIDLHLVHEVTSPQAFDGLRLAGRTVRRPDRTLATADHNVPTDGTPVAARIKDELSRVQVETLERNCAEFGDPGLLAGLRAPGHRPRDRARSWASPSRA